MYDDVLNFPIPAASKILRFADKNSKNNVRSGGKKKIKAKMAVRQRIGLHKTFTKA